MGVLLAHAAHLAQGNGHVFLGRQVIKEVEVLKDHADLRPEGAEGAPVACVQGAAFQQDFALVRGNEAVDALEQGAFAGAGGPDKHLEFPAVERQGTILQDGLSAEFFGKVGDLQYGFAHAYPAAPMPIVPPVE